MKFQFVKILFIAAITTLVITTVNCEVNPPSVVQAKLNSMFPSATAIQWENEHGLFEAELTVNGFDVEITFDQNGNLVEMDEEIPYDKFPLIIRNTFEKEHSSFKITKAMKLNVEGATQYSLIALFPGSRENFLFNEQGEILSHKIMGNNRPIISAPSYPNEISSNNTKWDLPVVLTEISGISLLNSNTMACVQDELGSIFLFDMKKNAIVSEIEFGSPGDYEGIAIVENNAYVLRSDGVIFEVSNFQSASKKVAEFKLNLPKLTQNFEGLCFDTKHNRLLIAPRTFDSDNTNIKGIYSFNLNTKSFSEAPVYCIDLNNPVFDAVKKTGRSEAFIPSEIAIHPANGDIYISDARNKLILVTSTNGDIKSLHPLNRNVFPKTEGIAITSDGQIYLSNEGKKTRPNILKLSADKLR